MSEPTIPTPEEEHEDRLRVRLIEARRLLRQLWLDHLVPASYLACAWDEDEEGET